MNPVDSRESAYDSASAEASAAVACVQCRSMSWKAVTPSQTGESACHAACAHILLRVRLNSHDLSLENVALISYTFEAGRQWLKGELDDPPSRCPHLAAARRRCAVRNRPHWLRPDEHALWKRIHARPPPLCAPPPHRSHASSLPLH